MTFKRESLTRGTLNIGTRELIKQEAIASGFYSGRKPEDLEDIELLRYVSSAGRQEWFDFLMASCDFLTKNGKIKKELKGTFNESARFAVSHDHVDIARKLFSLGAKENWHLNDSLYLSIMRGQHDMAVLLFKNGAMIREKYRLAQCMSVADDKMRKIIENGLIDTIRSRFRG